MLWGALGGVANAETKYLEHPEDRRAEVLGDSTIGALIPAGIKTATSSMALPDLINTMRRKVNPQELVGSIQKGYDTLNKRAGDIYEFVKGEAAPRGVGTLNMDHGLIDEAASKLVNSSETKELIKNAKAGDFLALRDLQSMLGQEAAGLRSSAAYSDNRLAPDVTSIRNRINESIEKNLNDYGAGDLAKMIKEANKYYTKMHETYSHPGIKNMVGKNRIVPENPMKIFSKEDKRINALLEEHPEIKDAVELEKKQKEIAEKLKPYKKVTGLAGKVVKGLVSGGLLYGGYSGAKNLFD